MKKLFIFTVLVMAGFAGCYKEPGPPDYKTMLSKHKWYLTAKIINNVTQTAECTFSEELTFKKEGTGYYYNATPCDTAIHGADSISFNWSISADNMNIYMRNIRGNPAATAVYNIDGVNDDILRFGGTESGGKSSVSFYAKSK